MRKKYTADIEKIAFAIRIRESVRIHHVGRVEKWMANIHATMSEVHHIPMLISEMFTEAAVQSRTFADPERPWAPPKRVTKVVTKPTCGTK